MRESIQRFLAREFASGFPLSLTGRAGGASSTRRGNDGAMDQSRLIEGVGADYHEVRAGGCKLRNGVYGGFD